MSLASTWRYVPRKGQAKRRAQIDLLFDRQDDAITVCEIKFRDRPFLITKDELEGLQGKLSVFKAQTRTKKQLFLSFITVNGIVDNPYKAAQVSGVVRLEDLFKA